MIRILLLLSVIAGLCFGCGFQFQGSGTVLPPDIKVVSIPLVQNNSTEPGLSLLFTEALRDRFERFGVVSVIEEGEADATLEAVIKSVEDTISSTSSVSDTQLQTEARVTIAATLKRPGGQLLWQNQNMVVARSFGATGDVVVTSSADFANSSLSASDLNALDSREVARGQQQGAFEQLAQEAARRIYNEAVAEDF